MSDTAAWVQNHSVSRGAFAAAVAKQQLLLQADTVALQYSSTTEFAVVLLAALANGIRVMLPQDATAASIAALKDQADLVLTDDLEIALRHGIAHRTSHFRSDDQPHALPVIHDDAELVFFTSGSSGRPKPVQKRWYQLRTETEALARLWRTQLQETAGIAATVSHQHIYGMLFRCLLPLHIQVPILDGLVEYPADLMQLTRTHQPIALVSSPAWLQRLPEAPEFSNIDQAKPGLSTLFSSGGPLPLQTALRSSTNGIPIHEVYGSTETGGIAWRTRTTATDEHWTLFDDTNIEIRDGCMAVRSPKTDNQWFQTADLADKTGTDSFVLQGRADRTVKIAEKRIALEQIESALVDHPDIQEASVFLRQGARPEIAAAVELTPVGVSALASNGKAAWTRAVRQKLADDIVRVALPRRWRIVETMPRTAAGKIDRAAIETLFREHRNDHAKA